MHGNRFTDEEVMAWFSIRGLEETQAVIPKAAGGCIKEKKTVVQPGVP